MSVWGNFGHLITGRAISAVGSLAATAVMARALGPNEFGLVVLLHTYVLAVRALLNLRLAEAFVKYSVPLLDDSNHGGLGKLLGLVRSIDLVTMLIATAVAVMGAPLAGLALDWSDEVVAIAMAYSLVLLASARGAVRGYLRATDRFDLLRTQLTVGPVVRLAGVLLAWWCDASWHYYALAWALSLLAGYLYLGWRGNRLINQAGLRGVPVPWRLAGQEFPGWLSFVGVVYSQGVLDQLPRHLITLLIGGFVGNAAAGLFRVAREVADVLAKPVQLIRQAAFTELTRLGHQGGTALRGVFRRYGLRLLLPAAGLVAVAAIWRGEILQLIGGADYVVAGTLLVMLLGAAAIELVGAILRPLAWAQNRAIGALRVQLLATLTYLGVFVLASGRFGVEAAGISALVAALVTLGGLGYLVAAKR